MDFAKIPLAAKLGVGAIGGLALLGGGVAAGTHLGSGAAQASVSTPVVATPSATPSPSSSPAANARSGAAQAAHRAALAAEAQVLGLTTKQLEADFKSGQTVQQLAAARGLSQAQFQAQYQPALKGLLDKEVAAGTLTPAQEQQALTRLTAAPPNWNQVAQRTPRPSPSSTP